MYLLFITVGLTLFYFLAEHLFNLFFEKHVAHLSCRSLWSVAIIVVASFVGYYVSSAIPSELWGNRFLHAFGGGFMGMLACFLVVKDSRIHIRKFQFFVFSFMVVTMLGVGNEIAECILQNYGTLEASTSINDTWLDLISNTIGIFIGSIAFTPFIGTIHTS